jgi:hypothetical protein
MLLHTVLTWQETRSDNQTTYKSDQYQLFFSELEQRNNQCKKLAVVAGILLLLVIIALRFELVGL